MKYTLQFLKECAAGCLLSFGIIAIISTTVWLTFWVLHLLRITSP